MTECNCRVCTDHRKWLAALNPQTPEAKAAFEEMCTQLESYSTDAVYWRMKFDGTWDKPPPNGCLICGGEHGNLPCPKTSVTCSSEQHSEGTNS